MPLPDTADRGRYRPFGSKTISVAQATNIFEALKSAKSIGLPLVAHLTIHWSGTDAFDDLEGSRFENVREGLSKALHRRGIGPSRTRRGRRPRPPQARPVPQKARR